MTDRKQHTWRRAAPPLIIVVALSLAFTGAASAQTTFQATVKGINPKPGPTRAPTTNAAGAGGVLWQREHRRLRARCLDNERYAHVADDLRMLHLHGHDHVPATGRRQHARPGRECRRLCTWQQLISALPRLECPALLQENSTWSVDPASSGVFFGMSGGGTDALETAGAQAMGTYTGILG